MPDITREEFLRGLRLSRDTAGNVSLYGPDGDHVVKVRGNLGLNLSAYQIGAWIADACQRASRTCATCKHWSRVSDNDFGVCGFWTDDRSTWHAYDDERCRNWQDKEAADA